MPRIESKNWKPSKLTRKRARDKRPPAAAGLSPEIGTDPQEIALALVLWKSLRCHGAFVQNGNSASLPTDASVDLGEHAIRLAKQLGVKEEFFALLFELRLVKVTLVPME